MSLSAAADAPAPPKFDARAYLEASLEMARLFDERVTARQSVEALVIVMQFERSTAFPDAKRARNVGPLSAATIADLRAMNLGVDVAEDGSAVVSW